MCVRGNCRQAFTNYLILDLIYIIHKLRLNQIIEIMVINFVITSTNKMEFTQNMGNFGKFTQMFTVRYNLQIALWILWIAADGEIRT